MKKYGLTFYQEEIDIPLFVMQLGVMGEKTNLLNFNYQQMRISSAIWVKAYRAQQVIQWTHRFFHSFSQMIILVRNCVNN